MPRSIVLGNGRLFAGLDAAGRARELTWPRVGSPNHLVDRSIRWGVFAGGRAAWLGEPGWETEARFEEGAAVGLWRHRHEGLGVELCVEEAVDPERDAWARRILAKSPGGRQTALLLATHDLALGQSDVGNTAFWEPEAGCVVHYRGEWAAAFALRGDGPAQYTCGITGFGGLEGTWRDADDGRLEGNPIAQGSVDSTLAVPLALAPEEWAQAEWCVAWADGPEAAAATSASVSAPEVLASRRAADAAWSQGVPAAHHARTARALQDAGGAWVAAVDSDILATNRATYAYCWPRDGAVAALAMLELGKQDEARRFLRFCSRVVRPEGPPFLQKYTPDGRLGASWHPWARDGRRVVPWQQDETALVLLAAAAYSARFGAEEFAPLAARCAGALAGLVADDGLPLPSWDMWEERLGVHAATVCLTVRALRDAAQAWPDGEGWGRAARRMAARFEEAFYDPESGRYGRTLGDRGLDTTPDSALLFGFRWEDGWEHAGATAEATGAALEVPTEVGGLARYKGDYYFRQTDEVPGNPWTISTIWWEEWRSRRDPGAGPRLARWLADRGGQEGILAEQYHPHTGVALSVSPLMWSHAEAAWFLARESREGTPGACPGVPASP